MIDFMKISTRIPKPGVFEIYPKFIIRTSDDLMIRGGDFYAVWVEDRKLWSTDEQDLIDIIDRELDRYAEENRHKFEGHVRVLHMWDAETGMIDRWHKYCQKQMRDQYEMLDEKLIFSNMEITKKDYASKRLPYPLETGEPTAWNKLISTLYSEEERMKIEWAIGAIVSGDSKKIQKFMVLYGEAGAGKSTILNVIQQLFEGYYAIFDAKALGSSSNQFALEAFRKNPLVGIQHDGDLSKIEDNTRINSLVSHEEMMVNEKYTKGYTNDFKCFLFMGTNKPVKITDAKSGLIRRLIDVTPSGNKLARHEYNQVMSQIGFELGKIANHCHEVYLENPGRYDDYIPIAMFGATNDFYNFIVDSYSVFEAEDGTTQKAAWEMYKTYCDEAKVPYPLPLRNFKEELRNYFWEYADRMTLEDGTRARSYYRGFRTDKFETVTDKPKEVKPEPKIDILRMEFTESIFDKERADCIAQYASQYETPRKAWDTISSTLSELDTTKLHFVKVPENHIVIDFDIKDETGKKSYELNAIEAAKWPATYAELSKSGQGIHLHYIYTGDPSRLSRIYDDSIEVKVFTGNSALRRKLSKCNDLPIATISSGLPLKGEDKLLNFNAVQSEKGLRTLIKRNLNKEIHASTKSSMDFICKILNDAYENGLKYDVSDMINPIIAFAAGSSNQSDYCLKLIDKMKFKSDDASESVNNDEAQIVFYDVEVFPNLFLVNWKFAGEGKTVVRMINPKPADIEELLRFRLIGFNCRRYDNHMLYGRLMGYNNEQIYNLSQRIIGGDRNAFFGEAYNISYTDVYDFSSKKQSLKKWEIELGIHHQELGLPWDKPVPKELWPKVAEYCDNDVLATEAVFYELEGDWDARQILAKIAKSTVNDTTNGLTTKIIFGKERKPALVYTDLATGERTDGTRDIACFPGYEFKAGKNIFRDVDVGFGGYVYAEPGMYNNVALLDVASMHPNSAINLNYFGEYTQRFKDILDARIAIKHGDYDTARTLFDGKLAEFLDDKNKAKALAQALKIAINSVYGLTSASFENPFRDLRNKNNIVALRGALFMKTLQDEVQARGHKVIHIKTDSIKIADATPEIIQFVMDFGKQYGYTFEHEDTYERICLVNNAVYIARHKEPEIDKATGKEIWWTATGKQFAVPYVHKSLFSKEPITFDDMCETMSVQTALYLDKNEGYPDVTEYEAAMALRYKPNTEENPWTRKEHALYEKYKDLSDTELDVLIGTGHNLQFVGKVGSFVPIKPGRGGGLLVREAVDKNGRIKFDSAVGAKDHRWLEAEAVKILGKEDDIDRSYYDNLVNKAVEEISKYGDFEYFTQEEPWPELPF